MPLLPEPSWIALLAVAMILTGLFSGLLAGLLGVGGGIVIVGVLHGFFPLFGIPEAVMMKLAIGTSLATIIPTSIQSARKHYATGMMETALLRAIWPTITFGVVLGTILAVNLRGQVSTLVFAVVALLVAINMGFSGASFRLAERFPQGIARHAIATFIGAVSAMMGIGGGTVGVPILTAYGVPIRGAVATASVFGLIISIPGTIGFIIGGWHDPLLPPLSLGYVNLVGFALIVPTSLLAAPWGVRLAHTIPPMALKRAFAVFLAITAARMFWSLLG